MRNTGGGMNCVRVYVCVSASAICSLSISNLTCALVYLLKLFPGFNCVWDMAKYKVHI